MLFNSYEFIFIFMPVVFVGYFLIAQKTHRGAIAWLGFASLFFYAYWSIAALPIMAISICINYWLSLLISNGDSRYRQRLLTIGIVSNLFALGYFKYANFFIENSNFVLDLIGAETVSSANIALPIGISFFTFTQIAFLIDSYQNKVKERSFIQYVLFVSFFPHLLAGPVLHHKQMMPQFSDKLNFTLQKDKITLGIAAFTIGLAKKVLVADTLSGYVENFYNGILQGLQPNFWISWIGSIGYTFQLYFDFSGYSDMAVGLALVFGIWLPYNFNSPFKASSIIDFWQRWHITLTKYVGEYLYAPITLRFMRFSQDKHPVLQSVISLVIPTVLIFLILGMWHGANWTFVVFGGMHGLYIVINHLWRKVYPLPNNKSKKIQSYKNVKYFVGWLLTFIAVNVAFVMFRADSVSTAIEVYKGMIGLYGFDIGGEFIRWIMALKLEILVIFISFVIVLITPNCMEVIEFSKVNIQKYEKWIYPIIISCICIIYSLYVVTKDQASPFLYFQF